MNQEGGVGIGTRGVGKTTVARIVADILYAKNMTQTNNFVEVTRQDLIGRSAGPVGEGSNQRSWPEAEVAYW